METTNQQPQAENQGIHWIAELFLVTFAILLVAPLLPNGLLKHFSHEYGLASFLVVFLLYIAGRIWFMTRKPKALKVGGKK